MKLNRRNFLTSAAGLAAGLTAGAAVAAPAQTPKTAGSLNNANENLPGAESWNREQGIRAKDEKLLRIGGVFGLWSHMSSSWWRYLNPPEGYARATGMRITHVWCVDPEAGARLAERYDAKLVSRYNEMVGQVEGMFIDDFLATPLMPDLALPYLEAGIPCFFDRPMTSSLAGLAKDQRGRFKERVAANANGHPIVVAEDFGGLLFDLVGQRLRELVFGFRQGRIVAL